MGKRNTFFSCFKQNVQPSSFKMKQNKLHKKYFVYNLHYFFYVKKGRYQFIVQKTFSIMWNWKEGFERGGKVKLSLINSN